MRSCYVLILQSVRATALNASSTREFRLSPPGNDRGLSCNLDGAFIGTVALLERSSANGTQRWRPRDCDQLSRQVGASYGLPIDMSSKMGGLKAISNALNAGDVARAQIATVLLGIPNPPLAKHKPPRSELIKFIRDLHWSGMIKWDPDKHPRWPGGSIDSQGGRFAPKGEGVESDIAARSARIQLADSGESDSSGDPIAEAAARAASAAWRDSGNTSPHAQPANNEHKDFWQALRSHLSHEAQSIFSEIGQAEINESDVNSAVANAQATAVADGLRAYANYRAQPWIGSDGVPIRVSAINTGNSSLDLIALMAHESFEPNAPLTRPGTNADWIDPLVNVVSVAAMGAGPALGAVGTGTAVAVDSSGVAADAPFFIGLSELPKDFDTTLPIGKYIVPMNAIPKTTTYGNLVADQIGRLVQNAYPKVPMILRTSPGVNGVDIELEAEDAFFTGFQYAEIKPLTNSGFNSFRSQVARWNLSAPVHAFTYDYEGNIYYGFPR